MTKPRILSRILKGLYHNELLALANSMSQNRKKWGYDKRKKRSMVEAIVNNCSESDLFKWFKEFCGKELPKEIQTEDLKTFPSIIQVGKISIGQLGVLEGTVERTRSECESTRIVLEQYFGKEDDLRCIWKELEKSVASKIPEESWKEPTSPKQKLVQAILAYASDDKISITANQLLEMEKIQVGVSGLYENEEEYYPWIVTKHGLLLPDREKASVENLADFLKHKFREEDLESELSTYHGDFASKILEFCIMENPEKILTKMFGLIELKKWAKKLNFCRLDSLHNSEEVATLILLKLGFSVPPVITGLSHYLKQLQSYKGRIAEYTDVRTKSGLMSQAYVDVEGLLKSLLTFYIGFLWSDEIENWMDTRSFKYEHGIKLVMKNKLQIQNPERITLGETIHAIRKLNRLLQGNRRLQGKMQKAFDRKWILQSSHLGLMDKVSGHRKKFTHSGEAFPGDEFCVKLIEDMLTLVKKLDEERIYPSVIRIVAEISDDYGKKHSRVVDENGEEWTVYSDEWLESTIPYFMHSKTNPIAVNPVLVQKIC